MPPQNASDSHSSPLDDFLNPKSMLTPGVAGSLVMLLTNTICYNFAELPHRWVGLMLSGTVGILILLQGKVPFWQKTIFYILNSLIIFSVGMGTANFAAQTTSQQGSGKSGSGSSEASKASLRPSLFNLFISTANAQEPSLISTNTLGTAIDDSNQSLLPTASTSNIQSSIVGQLVTETNISSQSHQVTEPINRISQTGAISSEQIQINYNKELAKLIATNEQLQLRINSLEATRPNPAQAKQPTFFQRW